MAALAFNMIKGPAIGKSLKVLSFYSALVAAVTTIETFANLAMTLSNKEALVSRLYVFLTSLIGIISMIVVLTSMISVPKYEQGMGIPQGKHSQCCARVIWWGVIDCESVPSTFWWYLAYRLLRWLCNTFICMFTLMRTFHEAGKMVHDDSSSDSNKKSSINDKKRLRREYREMPSTVDLHYLEWMVDCLSSLISLKHMLRRFDLPKDEGLDKWGQSIQVVLCTAGILHVVYLFFMHSKYCWAQGQSLFKWRWPHSTCWWKYEEIVREIGLEWHFPAREGGGILPTLSPHRSKTEESEEDLVNGHESSQLDGATIGATTAVSGVDQELQNIRHRQTRTTQSATQAAIKPYPRLHLAAIGDDEGAVRDLLNSGVNVNAEDNSGRTALM